MATVQQMDRKRRALGVVQRRKNFWDAIIKDDKVVNFTMDGKVCDPQKKFDQASEEERSLQKKLNMKATSIEDVVFVESTEF